MAKIDVYLRSIERFGAAGAILVSGQAVTLRFPQGDRHATQVTPHEQLVAIVREIAPPAALDQIDKNRRAKFDIESNGVSYSLTVTPTPGVLQVLIEGAAPAGAPAPAPAAVQPTGQLPRQPSRAPTAPVAPAGAEPGDLPIERGQYAEAGAARTTSGSALLDQWTNAARSARATDVFIATGTPPVARVGPLYVPGETGCFACQEATYRERFPLYDELVEQRRGRPSQAATLGPVCAFVGGQVALETVHQLTGVCPPASRGVAYVYDLRTMSVSQEEVPRVPGCPVCGG